MSELLTTLAILAAMGGVVLAFRLFVRRPKGLTCVDPPAVRSVAVFAGDAATLFGEDRPDEPLVGVAFFRELCDALAAEGVEVARRGRLQNAQQAVCVIEDHRLAVVLERADDRWVLSVEWVAQSAAERRHMTITHEVFAPQDGPGLRRLLAALHRLLLADRRLSDLRWYRKEHWMAEDTSSPHNGPLAPPASP